ncbi:AAA family ATPase [Sulfitobacter donghicola]|uniref:YhaN AAA domain-containing protein n=1 Tax=Sulfitobacter donghicola DSW-25 = KCTC 12864 = JCM 14565 TaxID=1300350 RepID=A0A073IKM8_9RHOB|nr:AAA family ATPase [Sulfitobacter donghicola]KEJ90324.1 hypothetical protein DSW25_07655 [Sulfitobacter donghicola DSW-25 = KCTC 12864 = JCM 14565]KIN66781.1 putative DNA double-strand break repair [Sulfitobacter donghicola DSW-25 = KCTC 12864 = JCM 14565]
MKLRSLTLSNVRKFAGQTAQISGIGDGVTVVSEANEFGKSTFFDAIHALFFLKYGAATREVKSLQPRSGGAVRIKADVELPEGLFTIEKSFLAQKRASVHDGSGALVALDDEAESWIAKLMGSGLDGPAGLLWVRQGVTALEPVGNTGADKTEKERLLGARRDLLSSVAGEIDMVTGGRRMDRVIEAAQQAFARLATATGQPKANGPWKEAEQEAQNHEQRHGELEARCRELSNALHQRREVSARLDVLEQPGAEEALQQALDTAQNTYNAARTHADKLAQAQAQAELRKLELTTLQAKLDGLIGAQESFEKSARQLEDANKTIGETRAALEEAETTTTNAQAEWDQATQTLADAMKEKDRLQQGVLKVNAVEKLSRLIAQLDQITEKRATLEEVRAALAVMPVTDQVLRQIQDCEMRLLQKQAEVSSNGVQMHLSYTGEGRLAKDGAAIPEGVHQLVEKQRFDIPGVGQMTLDPGGAAADLSGVEAAKAQLAKALSDVGLSQVSEARAAAVLRKEKADQASMLANVLETLAPEGIEQMQAQAAQAQAAVDAFDDPEGAASEGLTAEQMEEQIATARASEQSLRQKYDHSRDKRDAARSSNARAQVTRDAVQASFDSAAAIVGDEASFAERKADAARAQSTAEVAAKDAEAAAKTLLEGAPDLAMAQADLNRAKSAADNARQERSDLQTRKADLSATIRARAEDGVEEARDEAKGLMERAQARAARFAHEVAGLKLLIEALRAKRGAAQEAYFGPVQQELAPLLALLHADAALSFDPSSLLPQGIERGGANETMDMLSGGTQEQIAILTRLAFARLFAKQGKPMPVILDDALVYSDDSRISAMFTALHRIATDQQVIVFSCRQMAFTGLGGTRPKVQISQDS